MNEPDEEFQESDIQYWARHTIMDGKVVTYATGFEGSGRMGDEKSATGHFEVSSSRNGIIVHRCQVVTKWQYESFKAAMRRARDMHDELYRCEGRPEWEQPNEHS